MRILRTLGPVAVLLLLTSWSVSAQTPGGGIGAQSLRPYAHVFAAYAVAWVLIAGWIVSIHRRLGRLEKRGQD